MEREGERRARDRRAARGAPRAGRPVDDRGDARPDRVARRPEPADALGLARRRFRDGERVDMTALAEELGINRVTLYRWVGSRDHLLVAVLWSLAERVLAWAEYEERDTRGGERVVRVVNRFLHRVIADEGMQRFLFDEGELAMRLLTRADHDFQPRLTRAVHRLLADETERGALDLGVDLEEVAFAIVRIIESYTYLGLILGEKPDAARAEPILRLMLCGRAPAADPGLGAGSGAGPAVPEVPPVR